MRYESAKNLKSSDFKRSYGVNFDTFKDMVKVVKVERMLKKKTGRKDKLTIEDQVLMTLGYWREYRTYFHIGQDWKINESTAYRIIRRVEDMLIQSGLFALPGKKILIEPDSKIKTIVIDVTEHEVERPKKKRTACAEETSA
jgi:Helix-turn-helix of DDE superfamily endonuclease